MMALKSAARFPLAAIQANPTPFLIASSKYESTMRFEDIKNLDDAVEVFDHMLQRKPSPSVLDFNELLNITVKKKHFQQAVVLFKIMSEYSSSSIVIDSCSGTKQVDSLGFVVMATFIKRGCAPGIVQRVTQNRGIGEYGFHDIKNQDDAVKVFDAMLVARPTPSVSEYTKLLNAVVRMKHFQLVVVLFKRMCRLGCPMDTYTRTVVIDCYCKLKEVDSAFAVMGIFLKRGHAPNVASLSCLIKGLFLQGKAVEGVDLFDKVVREKLCEVTEFTTSIVLDGLCKTGNVVKAVELLGDFENGKGTLNAYGYTTVIDYLCKSSKVDEAMALLSRMIDRGFQPDVVSYNALIYGLCISSRRNEAMKLLKKMVDDKLYPNSHTFNIIINSHCKEGLMTDAEDVVRIMEQGGVKPGVITYTALMDGYCLQGRLDRARKVLNIMDDKGLKPNVISYSTIINGYCKHKKLDLAWQMFKELLHKGLKPDAFVYSTMIQGLFTVGRCSEAEDLYNEMKVAGVAENRFSYGIVLDGLLKNGKLKEAISFYHEVDNKGLAVHVSFYNIFINGLCRNNKLDLARGIFSSLPSKGIYPNVKTYNAMIQGLCHEGLFQEAGEMLEKMEQSGLVADNVTYTVIVDGCSKYPNSLDSKNLMKRIVDRG